MPDRHQTLSTTIRWSYDLLDETAKALLAELSAFRGGFSLDIAEHVCEVEDDLLPPIALLTEHSLLRADVDAELGPRFTMLGTIRRFARDRLEESDRRDRVLERHARSFVALTERVGGPGGRQRAALDAIEVELDNIRAAFDWFVASADPEPVARAMGESWWFWWTRGYVKEGELWADRCLEAPNLGPESRSRLLVARAMFAIWSGEYELAVPAFVEAAETARAVGDRRGLAYTDIGLGLVRAVTSSVADGRELIQRGTASFDVLGDGAGATTGLAALSWVQGITRQFDDTDETLRHALDRARRDGSEVEIGITESALAQFQMAKRNTGSAIDLIARSLDRLSTARHIGSTILTLEVIAELGIAAGETKAAVVILGATASIRSVMGTRVPPDADARLARLMAVARQQSCDDFVVAFQRGARMTFPEAVSQGREVLERIGSVPRSSSSCAYTLGGYSNT